MAVLLLLFSCLLFIIRNSEEAPLEFKQEIIAGGPKYNYSFSSGQQSLINSAILYIATAVKIIQFNQKTGEIITLMGCEDSVFERCDTADSLEKKNDTKATNLYYPLSYFYVLEDLTSGNKTIYVSGFKQIIKIDNDGLVSVFAGYFGALERGDGGLATKARFLSINSLWVDQNGIVFVCDYTDYRIRRIGLDGIISTFAGSDGLVTQTKLDGFANETVLSSPKKIVGMENYLFVIDSFSTFKIEMKSGWLTVISGREFKGGTQYQVNGLAINASLNDAAGISVTSDGTILVSLGSQLLKIKDGIISSFVNLAQYVSTDVNLFSGNYVNDICMIGRVDLVSGELTRLYDCEYGSFSDFIDGKFMRFNSISAMTLNETSRLLYIADDLTKKLKINVLNIDTNQVVKYSLSNKISNESCTVPGASTNVISTIENPSGLILNNEKLLVASNVGLKFNLQQFSLNTNGNNCMYAGSITSDRLFANTNASRIILNNPMGIHCSTDFTQIYIADTGNHRIRKITKDGIINTIVGTGIAGFNGDSLHPLNTHLNSPQYATSKRIGILISDTLNHRVRIVPYTNASTVSTLVGLGSSGSTIVENNPRQTELNSPSGIEVIRNGFFFYDIYIADSSNHRILQVKYQNVKQDSQGFLIPEGTISTLAGTTVAGYNGDGITAKTAKLFNPTSITVHSNGFLIADSYNNRIRFVSRTGFIYSKVSNDDGNTIGFPFGVCSIVSDGSFFFTENNNIRKLDTLLLTPVGGIGDGMSVYNANVYPAKMVKTSNNELVISESNTNRIRLVDNSGIIRTIAGTGKFGFSGDGSIGILANLRSPTGLAINPITKDIVFSDTSNHRIRKLTKKDDHYEISTIAGSGEEGFSSGTDPLQVKLSYPRAVSFLSNGDLVIGDTLNYMLRIVSKGKIRTTVNHDGILSDIQVTSDNTIYLALYDTIMRLTPMCNEGYQLDSNRTECLAVCFGIPDNETLSVCHNHGACVSPNKCQCQEKYTGSQCEIPICYGITANNSQVCSNNNGTCSEPDSCRCNDGYYGFQCENAICFSKLIGDSCGGSERGICTSRNKCSCKGSFIGEECQLSSCSGISEKDPHVCYGRGVCKTTGDCECNFGYSGNNCQDGGQIIAFIVSFIAVLFLCIALVVAITFFSSILIKKNRAQRKIIQVDLALDERLIINSYHLEPIAEELKENDFIIPLQKLGMEKPMKRLGEGGVGSVYQTMWSGMIVAVKVFDLNNVNISEEDFRVEAILLSKLRHPNIINFYGVSTSPTKRYIVMECLEQSLDKVILKLESKTLALPLVEKIKMLISISNGVEYLHNLKPRKIIHRYLSPFELTTPLTNTYRFYHSIELYQQFEELQNYMLINKNLFYDILMNDDLSLVMKNMWHMIIENCEYCVIYGTERNVSNNGLDLVEGNMQKIRKLFSMMNDAKTFIRFFKLDIRLCHYFESLINGENDSEIELERFRSRLDRIPSLTQDSKNASRIMENCYHVLKSNFPNQIEYITKNGCVDSNEKNQRISQLIRAIFDRKFVDVQLTTTGMTRLCMILAFVELLADKNDPLIDKIIRYTITDNDRLDETKKSETLLRLFAGEYGFIESIFVRRDFERIQKLADSIPNNYQKSTLIWIVVKDMISVYFKHLEFFDKNDCLEDLLKLIIRFLNSVGSPFKKHNILYMMELLSVNVQNNLTSCKSIALESFVKIYDCFLTTKSLQIEKENELLEEFLVIFSQKTELFEKMLEKDEFSKTLELVCDNGTIFTKILSQVVEFDPRCKCYSLTDKKVKFSIFQSSMDSLKKTLGEEKLKYEMERNGFRQLINSIVKQCGAYKNSNPMKIMITKIDKYLTF
ncbi:predicted protein [Naegleria gruberi]|uniref:Predicted protein n=1 Tax=Naegleria gruberi TaxID=5762 RepID=D2VJI0_NAEGR|nr:uncharacterized protein NAEGRDRAFT_50059 [Naegleria gruberi]EFC43044.1 predicted protein [Naegleria gruberi]|eukprot:XP_002675788.1 predicted protein [Naegleria gruberi strain NEG-M]